MNILGKVASIMNEREVIINKGSDDGVEEGMTFRVTSEGVPVTDPDTGESLGVFIRDKIGIKISEVHPKFSVARTYETYTVQEPSSTLSLSRGGGGRLLQEVTRVRTLKTAGSIPVQDKSYASITDDESIVQVGDPVIQNHQAP